MLVDNQKKLDRIFCKYHLTMKSTSFPGSIRYLPCRWEKDPDCGTLQHLGGKKKIQNMTLKRHFN